MKKTEDKKSWYIFLGLLGFVLITVVCVWWYFVNNIPPKNAGEYGDIYGGATALFSGLAFAALWYSVRLQKTELKKTVEQLEITAKEQTKNTELNSKIALIQGYSALLNSNSALLEHNLSNFNRVDQKLSNGKYGSNASQKAQDYKNKMRTQMLESKSRIESSQQQIIDIIGRITSENNSIHPS